VGPAESLCRSISLCFGRDPRGSAAYSTWQRKDLSHDLNMIGHVPGHNTFGFKQAGYVDQMRFEALPSVASGRLLLPVDDLKRRIMGLEVYTPFAFKPRLLKSALSAANSFGLGLSTSRSLLIASKYPFPLRQLVCETLGEPQSITALSIGTPGAYRKLTIQVMKPDGRILGYVKMPLGGDLALARIRNEAKVVRMLASFPDLRAHVPRLLFDGDWQDRSLIFQSPLRGEAGPTTFGDRHRAFLRKLYASTQENLPGSRIVEEIGVAWNKVAREMGAKWSDLGAEVLRRAASCLEHEKVACAMSHGDFAPWNTRLQDGELAVFDWEFASTAPMGWDRYHFLTQTEALLGIKTDPWADEDDGIVQRCLFALYLLKSTADSHDEGSAPALIELRKQLLTRLLQST